MKTLNNYISEYSNIAKRLGYTGESINILVHMLANASYISEVEQVAYTREASLDKALYMNSKIQHCMDHMYSVYRGHCPRVVISVNFLRPVSFMPYDEIVRSSNFSIYYIGEYIKEVDDEMEVEVEEEDTNGDIITRKKSLYKWTYREGQLSLSNADLGQRYIVGFIAPSKSTSTITTSSYQKYFIESSVGNLSNDVCVKISETGEMPKVSRNFSDHILDPTKSVFDLTTTDYGSRVYFFDYFTGINEHLTWNDVSESEAADETSSVNVQVEATFYTYSTLDSYNSSELSRILIKGGELVPFDLDSDNNFLFGKLGFPEKGIVYIRETPRDVLSTIHYKANRSRFLNTILRSNADVGYILEEYYPEAVKSGGTYYKFTNQGDINLLDIYYIPQGQGLTAGQIEDFKSKRKAYYVADSDYININAGTKWKANFDISLELFKNLNEDYYTSVGKTLIIEPYKERFGIIFDDDLLEEIKAKISKLDNIKKISGFQVTYEDSIGNIIESLDEVELPEALYYEINVTITTTVKQ